MKRTILSIIFLLVTTPLYSQSFTIGEDGIVRCKGVSVGTTRTLFGDVYEVVDRNLLIQRRDEGKDLTKVCVSNVTDMSTLFSGIQFNQSIGNWDVSSVTNMRLMFFGNQFNKPIGNWDVGSVTNMNGMFSGSQFNQPIGNWDVSSVKDMRGMFSFSQFNQPIGNWDVSSVLDMRVMFYGSQFNQLIGNWNVSSVLDMRNMFLESQFNQPIGDWDVSSVTDMRGMFANSQFNQPIGNWDVGKVTDMMEMFSKSQFNQPIGDWDVSSVTNMNGMFDYSRFNQPIGNWDVSSVTDMGWMFHLNRYFNQPIGDWDVSSVKSMVLMFYLTPFNQPIWKWDVSSVTNLDGMFQGSPFNQPINLWCVSKITTEPVNFSTNSPLTTKNKPVWGTCPSIPPPKTIQLSPLINSTGVSRNVNFSWKSDTLSTKYQLQVFEGFDPIVVDVLVSDTTYSTPSTLKGNVDYYWRVRGYFEPRNSYGEWSSVWKFTTQLGTSIEMDEQPTQFTLFQNYPNPFNPTTQISFSLPNTTHVQFEVYSILGQRVSTLVDGTINSGNHTVSFDGSNLSSGVYIYRLSTPNYSQSRIMNLVK